MSKVYNTAFRMGILFNILLWTTLNVANYKIAEGDFIRRQIESENSQISFGGGVRFGKWGTPFDWDAKYFVIEGAGAILNILTMAVCGFFFGFLFKFVWSKISSRRIELK